jgi:toxin-antitoxin system PIN domain toxin
MKLVDVNVWLAGVWARHVHHDVARRWIDDTDDELVFCRVTEMALLRLLTIAAVMGPDVMTRRRAWDLVLTLQADPRVRFLQEPTGLAPLWLAYSKRDDRSHHLWTDDYLAAFAQAGGLEFVTLDAKVPARYPAVRSSVLD